MNTPNPSSSMIKRKKPPAEAKKTPPPKTKPVRSQKLHTFVATLPNGRKVEVRAPELLAVGGICKKKFKQFPIAVEKKSYEMPEHLTQRLSSHEGLRALQRSMTKVNTKAGRN